MSSSVLDLSLGDIIKKSNKSGRGRRGRGRGRRGRGRGRGRRSFSRYGPSRSRGRGRGRRRGRGRGRRQPYSNLRGKSIKQIALGHAGKRGLKVSAESEAKKVAGAICHCLRIGGVPPALIAKGTTPINQAIKAIAIARSFLEAEDEDETIDLIAQPAFRGGYVSNSTGCIIHVRRANSIELSEGDIEDALTITNKTEPSKLAGALAGRVRERKRVSLSAIGPKGVMRAVETIAVARSYLKNENIDLKFTPTMKNVSVDGQGEMTAIYFSCLPRRVQ